MYGHAQAPCATVMFCASICGGSVLNLEPSMFSVVRHLHVPGQTGVQRTPMNLNQRASVMCPNGPCSNISIHTSVPTVALVPHCHCHQWHWATHGTLACGTVRRGDSPLGRFLSATGVGTSHVLSVGYQMQGACMAAPVMYHRILMIHTGQEGSCFYSAAYLWIQPSCLSASDAAQDLYRGSLGAMVVSRT
jgi:hypothetical protein